ncbi:hypothetical protein F5876DRAFT_81495 [Lentinula aff. lateritia]|uniref:Uncharacterized protein n=1 Tax=Lentinula aff. lateritia TaxID=2804960 RepID=A0ACC1TMG9_9AGAR|nr:hypothetical protein F5876DRAFT_81495 [Lentinula aff. lateritia]
MLHSTPAHHVSWTISKDVRHRYDELLHSQTSSTSILLELNMLDEQDSQDVDHQELEQFRKAQEQEPVFASQHKHAHASPPLKGPSKRKRLTKTATQPVTSDIVAGEVPQIVCLVFPPAQPAPCHLMTLPSDFPFLDSTSSFVMAGKHEQISLVQGPASLAQLAEVMGQ